MMILGGGGGGGGANYHILLKWLIPQISDNNNCFEGSSLRLK